MIVLNNLSAELKAKGMTEARLVDVTNIEKARLHKLIYPSLRAEAWFDEAVLIARAVGVAGILPLIGAPTLAESRGLPAPLPNDLDMLRAAVRLPLGLACNIAIKLGLSDPIDLIVSPLMQQIWSVVASGERVHPLSRHGRCPWCIAEIVDGAGHLSTCLPENLLGARGAHVVEIGDPPQLPRKNAQSGTMPARGLKALRTRMGLTQAEMAGRFWIDANQYAQLERCDRPLTVGMAKRFTQASKIPRELFYVDPEAQA